VKEGHGVVRFGVFELDVSAGELRKQGRKVNLQQQPFQVLALLLRRPGELVTREELQQALWPADTFVEFDQGLNTAIKKIRQALDDSADHPSFVETLPRKGYRFIAAVSEVGSATESAPPAKLYGWRLVWVAAALALAVAASGAAWLFSQPEQTTGAALVPVPLTTDQGSESGPSFSPDGTQLVFDREQAGGVSEIRLKRVGDGESVRLADGCCPAWSPDGSSIAFLTGSERLDHPRPETPRGLYLVSPLGGSPRKLTDVYPGDFPSLAWHPGGEWLFVTDRESPAEPAGMFLLSLDGREKRRLTSPPEGTEDGYPAVSPDGEALVFGRYMGGSSTVLYLLELSEEGEPKGEPRRLPSEGTYSNEAAWTPQGRAIVFAGGTFHTPNLYGVPLSRPGWRPGKAERLVFAGEGVRRPAISSQGLLAYTTSNCVADIWRLELNGEGRAAAPPGPLISSTRLDHVPQYSPDGKRIAFASNRSGSHEIWVSNSDGSGAAQLTSMGGYLYTANPRWSPDGRLILFGSNPEGRKGTYVIDANGGTPELLFEDIGGVSFGARVIEWAYFERQEQVWRRRWPPLGKEQEAVQITRGGGYGAQQSADGKALYYAKDVSTESTGIWKVPVEGGEETQVLESVWRQHFAVWKGGIYFIPDWPPGDQPSIQFLSFSTGMTTKVVTLSHSPAYGFSLSPDGRSLLFTQYQRFQGDLWMVENFR